MGLGFVLIVWAILGTLFAIAAGTTLAGICFLILRSRTLVDRRWILAFAVAPFLCGLYCFVAFIGYGIWCETKRGVDFGLGDSFRVQLGNHYEFQAIDTPERPFLVAPDGTQLHDGLQRLGLTRNWIYGEVSPTEFFLIDTTNKSETSLSNFSDLSNALHKRGVVNLELLSPGRFYRKHRFGSADLIAAGLIAIPPAGGFFALLLGFGLALRRSPVPNACEETRR